MVRIRSFKGRKVLVTGGSSGIGLAVARAFMKSGAKVAILARDERKLKRASKELKGILTIKADVSRPEDLERARERVEEHLGRLDILVNSAGIVHPLPLADLTAEQVRSIVEIDLLGTINACKEFLGSMRSPGHIVNISSMAGLIGVYGYSVYSAAKFGTVGFSEALRMELAPNGIGVSVVFPPDTLTPQLEGEERQKPRELKAISGKIKPVHPDKVAASILEGIKKGTFLIFTDMRSRLVWCGYRWFGPAYRWWFDRKVEQTRKKGV